MITEASFEGEFAVDPPLTAEERQAIAAQKLPIPERAKTPRGACHWVSNGDGTAIIWDRDPDFDRSVDWLRFLVRHYLKPKGHVIKGKVVARAPDGSRSEIRATKASVTAQFLNGPIADEYAFVIGPRGRRAGYGYDSYERSYESQYECRDCGSRDPLGYNYHNGFSRADDRDYGREYDAAFDRDPDAESLFNGHGDADRDEQLAAVREFCAGYAGGLHLVQNMELRWGRLDTEIFGDAVRGVALEVRRGGIMVISMPIAPNAHRITDAFDEVLAFANALAAELHWVVWDPAQHLAARPGTRFRDRAIAFLEHGRRPDYPFRSRRAA